jgi:glucosyl-3-phosphoglycerate synthase
VSTAHDRRVRRFPDEVDPIAAALRAKAGRTVSVCIPCRDEAATIGPLVQLVRSSLVDDVGLVDELVVLDDRSSDGSALVAARAGARVVPIQEVHAVHGEGHGKGNALWASLLVSAGDLVVWCDADVTSLRPDWIARLAAPLLADATVALVKAAYDRPTDGGGGGRTTELVARPLLSLLAPDLAMLSQPLAGEYAGRRSVLEQLPFVEGWGVEIAMLMDIAARFGPAAIAEVDLGVRAHRHRSLHALAVQAAEVTATALGRAGLLDTQPVGAGARHELRRADGSAVPLDLAERPPVAGLTRPSGSP